MLSILDMAGMKRLLCLGAHCDNIEIGAGRTILHLAKSGFAPDLILTHHDDDRLQDHRLVSQLTCNTFEYEIMY
jgi:LmbE family N-acetylglucosaminyl deacetylase